MPTFVATAIVWIAGLVNVTLVATGTLVVIAANVIFAVGSTLIASAFRPKPKAGQAGGGQQPWRGDTLQISMSPTEPRKALVGRTATAGSLRTWVTKDGSIPNQTVFLYFPVADHPCEGIVGGTLNGNRITFDASIANTTGRAPVAEFVDGSTEYLWITFRSGMWQQDADADLVSYSAGRHTALDRGRGVAEVKVEALQPTDPDVLNNLFPNGLSTLFQFLWEVDGYRAYDRRLDGSAGGTGSHRADDASTWDFTNNCAVLTENVLRGLSVEDEDEADLDLRARDVFFGLELTEENLPFDECAAAMNACDESVSLRAGGSESRYTANGVVDCTSSPETVLNDMVASMAGSMVFGPAGRWFMRAGVAQTPVYAGALTDGDRRIDGPYDYTDHIPLAETASAIHGRFSDPSQLYQAIDLPPRINTDADAEDGGRRIESLDLPFVTSNTQGQRILEIHRRRGRRQKRETSTWGPENIGVEPGDWVDRDAARYGAVTFEVAQATIKTDDKDLLMVTWSLEEIHEDDFAWDPDADEASPGTPLGSGLTFTTPGAWSWEADQDYPDGITIRLWAGGGFGGLSTYTGDPKGGGTYIAAGGGGGGEFVEQVVAGPVSSGVTYAGVVGAFGANTTCTTLSLTAHYGADGAPAVPGAGGTGMSGGTGRTCLDGRSGGLMNLSDGGGAGYGGGDQTLPATAGTTPGGGGSADLGAGANGAVQILTT